MRNGESGTEDDQGKSSPVEDEERKLHNLLSACHDEERENPEHLASEGRDFLSSSFEEGNSVLQNTSNEHNEEEKVIEDDSSEDQEKMTGGSADGSRNGDGESGEELDDSKENVDFGREEGGSAEDLQEKENNEVDEVS